jgi:hypothetical protein
MADSMHLELHVEITTTRTSQGDRGEAQGDRRI